MPSDGYETRDVSSFGILATFIGLILFGAAVGGGLSRGLDLMKARFHADAAPSPFSPPAPRLEVDEPAELDAYRNRERQLLGSYGATPGKRHIPIARAMEILVND